MPNDVLFVLCTALTNFHLLFAYFVFGLKLYVCFYGQFLCSLLVLSCSCVNKDLKCLLLISAFVMRIYRMLAI